MTTMAEKVEVASALRAVLPLRLWATVGVTA